MVAQGRHRFGLLAFSLLLMLHLAAAAIYLLNERQYLFLQQWRDGREASRTGRHAEAATALRAFATGYRKAIRPVLLRRDFPPEAQAWLALGRTERELGRYEPALAAFAKAAALGDAAAWRESHLVLWTLGDAERLERLAVSRLGSAILTGDSSTAGAGNPEAWQHLGAAYWWRGDRGRAVAAYERGLQELPRWLARQGRPARAADGGAVDEVLVLHLLAGSLAWLEGDARRGSLHCRRLAALQDRENPLDGLCLAAAAVANGTPALALEALELAPVAPGEQAALAAEIRRRSLPAAPASRSASPSPAPATRPPR